MKRREKKRNQKSEHEACVSECVQNLTECASMGN